MEDPDVDEFTRHHLILTELVERLPAVRNDADAYAFALVELASTWPSSTSSGPPPDVEGGGPAYRPAYR